jgi:hypothetical protein
LVDYYALRENDNRFLKELFTPESSAVCRAFCSSNTELYFRRFWRMLGAITLAPHLFLLVGQKLRYLCSVSAYFLLLLLCI